MTEKKPLPPEETFLAADNEAVIKHMEMYQGIITRMAGNSAGCKTWGVPLVAAILGFVVQSKNADLAILAFLVTLILYFLDCYYLVLENRFRDGFDSSAKLIREGNFSQAELFKLHPSKEGHWLKALTSFATWPLYLGLISLVILGYFAVAV